MRKPNILILENSVAVTGALNSILRSSQYLSNQFHFVFVLPENSTAKQTVIAAGFACEELPMLEIKKRVVPLLNYLPRLMGNVRRFRALLNKHQIDLVVNNDFYNLLPASYRFFGGNVPYVCYVRFLPSRFPNVLVKLWNDSHRRYSSKMIAVSNAVVKALPENKNIVVIGNELPIPDLETYTPSTSQTILYVANFTRGKGQEFALEAFSKIAPECPGWKLRFVGGDMGLEKNREFRMELQRRASALAIDSQVEWVDFVHDLSREYRAAALVLNFSESESFSLTCLEAQFYGRAVVATDSGGPAEIIDHQITGLIVPVAGLNAMTAAIRLLVQDSVAREIMGREAFSRVRRKFSYQNTIDKLAEVYRQFLGKK